MERRVRTAIAACGTALLLVTGAAAPAWASMRSGAAPAASRGCTNAGTVPVGAVTGRIQDVDGDGKADSQYYGVRGGDERTGGHLVYGIRTAAGGVIEVRDPMKGLRVHSGWISGTDGMGVVAVIDDGETATLYAFRGCRLVQPHHPHGGPYVFTLGAGSRNGTGVACNDQNGGVLLERADARRRSNGDYDVVRSIVRVSEDGRTAARQAGAGSTEVRWANLKPSDRRVKQARGSFCNDVPKVAGRQD